MKNYQAIFLNTLRREGQTVTIITTNGYQMSGRITAFDQDTLVIEGKDGQQLTYKHAISTIIPEKTVELEGSGEGGRECRS